MRMKGLRNFLTMEQTSASEDSPTVLPMPTQGRLAGIDFGTVRIGLSLSDRSQTWVTPLATYSRRGDRQDIHYFRQLVAQEQIVGWVIGLPIHCSGDESQKSAEARRFAAWLGEQTSLPVALFDERFTTAEARQLLNETQLSPQKKRQRLDGLAAHLILSHFLGARGRCSGGNASLDDTVGRTE